MNITPLPPVTMLCKCFLSALLFVVAFMFATNRIPHNNNKRTYLMHSP